MFRKPATTTSAVVAPARWQERLTVSGPWDVSFQPNRGAPPQTKLSELRSLSENADPGIKYFSGIATYSATLQVPADLAGRPLMPLDLGQVGDIAEVKLNGQSLGGAWKAPYRVDVSKVAHSGANTLEVRVADLWVNRLIGDAQPGMAKITFTTAPTYKADAPLRPAGLIGPVTLLTRDRSTASPRH